MSDPTEPRGGGPADPALVSLIRELVDASEDLGAKVDRETRVRETEIEETRRKLSKAEQARLKSRAAMRVGLGAAILVALLALVLGSIVGHQQDQIADQADQIEKLVGQLTADRNAGLVRNCEQLNQIMGAITRRGEISQTAVIEVIADVSAQGDTPEEQAHLYNVVVPAVLASLDQKTAAVDAELAPQDCSLEAINARSAAAVATTR